MESSVYSNGACTLVIMAKAPRPGAVKTRLARSLPIAEVTDLYRCLLADTIALGKSLDGVEVALMCPEADAEGLAQATGNSIPVVPQNGRGLAAGLTTVFAHFSAAGARRIVAFNSDSPHLPAAILETAFHSLMSSDVVVGPTQDGGYYLVGAKTSHPELFVADAMGTTNAYDALLLVAATYRGRASRQGEVVQHPSSLTGDYKLVPSRREWHCLGGLVRNGPAPAADAKACRADPRRCRESTHRCKQKVNRVRLLTQSRRICDVTVPCQ